MQTTNASKLYAGADLHGNNVFLSICDTEGQHVFRKRVKTNMDGVIQVLEPFRDRLVAVGVESTFNWYWLVDGLFWGVFVCFWAFWRFFGSVEGRAPSRPWF